MAGQVVVACKLPHGLILRNFEMVDVPVPVLGGGLRTVQEARQKGGRVEIHGNAIPVQRDPERDYPQIVGGYALTYGVDADFWEAWLKANETSAIVKNRLVFAFEKVADTRAAAKENAGLKSGLEPLLKDGDPRMPHRAKVATQGNA